MTFTRTYDPRPPGSPPVIEPPLFMSRVWSRSPQWKSHTTEGHARAATTWSTSFVRDPEIWRFDGDHWTMIEPKETP